MFTTLNLIRQHCLTPWKRSRTQYHNEHAFLWRCIYQIWFTKSKKSYWHMVTCENHCSAGDIPYVPHHLKTAKRLNPGYSCNSFLEFLGMLSLCSLNEWHFVCLHAFFTYWMYPLPFSKFCQHILQDKYFTWTSNVLIICFASFCFEDPLFFSWH